MFIEDVQFGEGRSLQLQASTDTNSSLIFAVVEVTDGQSDYVSLNSSGYLTISASASTSFFIDVRILQKLDTKLKMVIVIFFNNR